MQSALTYQMHINDTLSVITLAFCCGNVNNSSLPYTLHHSTNHTHTFSPESWTRSVVAAMWQYCRLNSMLFMRMNVLSVNIFRIHAKRNPKRILQNQHISIIYPRGTWSAHSCSHAGASLLMRWIRPRPPPPPPPSSSTRSTATAHAHAHDLVCACENACVYVWCTLVMESR